MNPLYIPDSRHVCQVLVGTTWAPVDLASYGHLTLAEGRWTCSPREFARRHQEGLARIVRHVGEIVDGDVVAEEVRVTDAVLSLLTAAGVGPASAQSHAL